MRRLVLLGCVALATIAAIARSPALIQGVASLKIGAGPFFPGSRILPRADGIRPPYNLTVVGPGSIIDGAYLVPTAPPGASATLLASNAVAIGAADIRVASPPSGNRSLLAVAAYDEGVVLHDPLTFQRIGTIATGGNPSDVAFSAAGDFAATDTSGNDLTTVARAPWSVATVRNVPVGNEVTIGTQSNAIFVSDRDVAGTGALTRISSGTSTRIITGETAEGLALDDRRGIIYVGNVNDGTVLAVDSRSMHPLRRISAVPRVFGIALSSDGNVLFAVANQSAGSRFQAPGFVSAIALGAQAHPIARSRHLRFPLGIAFDPERSLVFVTDEEIDVVYVLDAKTLRDAHTPLKTCDTPWKPYYDSGTHTVFVPCARANRIDAFDARTLRRVHGSPFRTGAYPLAVSIWRPHTAAVK